ncbi:MAG TPA: hypothetical protein VJN69_10065 [Candidatus Acidoferrales bacterium]|nr:hypothetical protein [Candidatus Acidoferrales bacterium]
MTPQRSSLERALEEAVSRALRDNLAPLQLTANELHQAYADLVASCASTKPSNALPAMLRAQTAAAALAAGLSVLSNFVAVALNPRNGDGASSGVGAAVMEAPSEASIPVVQASTEAELEVYEAEEEPISAETAPLTPEKEPDVAQVAPQKAPKIDHEPKIDSSPAPQAVPEPIAPEDHIVEGFVEPAAKEIPVFDIAALPPELQDLHRRANRVAKVAMQDIKLLRPKDVESGRQNKDICGRLRVDLDKARKEYDRRFRAISDHPVDYFHHWMLEILAGGDRAALGEYPYPSAVLRH